MIKKEFLNLKTPEIWLEEKEFILTFKKGEVEIEVDWNTTCCGGTERIILNTDELEAIIKKLRTI